MVRVCRSGVVCGTLGDWISSCLVAAWVLGGGDGVWWGGDGE